MRAVADGGEAAGEGEAGREVEGSRGERREKRGERLRERENDENNRLFFLFFLKERGREARGKNGFSLLQLSARVAFRPPCARDMGKRETEAERLGEIQREREREREKTR